MKKLKKSIIIGIIIVLSLGVVFSIHFFTNQNNEVVTESELIKVVEVDDIIKYKEDNSSVIAIGELEAMDQVDLKSQFSAEIIKVNVKIGEKVNRGDLLVELDHASFDAQLGQAGAAIGRAQSGLEQRVAGANDEDIDRVKKAVEQAEASLQQVKVQNEVVIKNAQAGVDLAKSALDNTGVSTDQAIQDAYSSLRLAIENGLPTIFNAIAQVGDILGESPGKESADDLYEQYFSAQNTQYKLDAEISFNSSKSLYENIKLNSSLLNSSSDINQIEKVAKDYEDCLNKINLTLDNVRKALDKTVTSGSFTAISLNGLKTSVDMQISSIGGAKSGLEALWQRINNVKISDNNSSDVNQINYEKALSDLELAKKQAKANLESAQAALDIQKASYNAIVADPREVDLSSFKSSIREAQAAYGLIIANRDKAFIRAPFSGTVSAVPVRVHDLANPGQLMVSVVNTEGLQVKSFISEKDRLIVKEGDKAVLEGEIEGLVTHVSPSLDQTTKKVEVIVSIVTPDAPLAVGQIVEVEIRADRDDAVDDVYILPLKAVTVTQRETYVYVVEDREGRLFVKKHMVEAGDIKGQAIEVMNGFSDSDRLIIDGNKLVEDGEEVNIIEK